MHLDTPTWSGLFNAAFGISSLLLAVFYGAGVGNVIRGVPLRFDGYFFLALWTDPNFGQQPGVLDRYTVRSAVLAAVALEVHGANYAALTTGDLNRRSRQTALRLWPVLAVLTAVSLAATLLIRPALLENYRQAPVLYAVPALVVAALAEMWFFARSANEGRAFASSCAYPALMLAGAAAAMDPNLLLSTVDAQWNITVFNANSGNYALSIGLIWWSVGMLLAAGYFVFIY
jgi:cytochrome d ubiquinol oxidase subunit II